MSRTRLIRPAFFADECMARLSFATQLVYIGLWTVADDAGYFERRPAEIAAELFRYKPPSRRLRLVEQALEALTAEGRITWLECDEHGVIPTLPEHGVIAGGNHAYTSKARHESVCQLTLFRRRQASLTRSKLPSTDVSRTSHVSGSVSESGSGSVSSNAQARDDAPTLKERVGWTPRQLAGAKP